MTPWFRTPVDEMWREIWRDSRQAVRGLRSAPAFTAVALIVLTLSIGASTAIFSVVDAVMLRGLPFEASERLVSVGEVNLRDSSPGASRLVAPQNFLDWRARQDVFSHLAAVGDVSISLKREGRDEPQTLRAQWVTADFFPALRAMPMLGRPFTAGDEVEGRAQVAVISYGLWQRRFGGAPDVIGRRLPGQLASFEILGVMPPAFAYPVGDATPTDVWVPFVAPPEARVRGNSFGYSLQVIGRLRDDVTIEQAQQRMDLITADLAAETPRWFTDRVARVTPLRDDLTRDVRTWMLMLLAAVGFVLLIACVNLANLMLVRATTRAREMGIRSALGASRGDLVRIVLIESLVLSLAGAALGVLAAWTGVELLRTLVPEGVPRSAAIAIDLRVLGAATSIALITGLAFGIAPALRFSRPGAGEVLNHRERGSTASASLQRARALLVVSQVALAVILLVGSGLFLASFARVTSIDLGFDPERVLTVRVRPLVGRAELAGALQRNRDKLSTILERVRAIPGVEVASMIGGGLPLRGDLRTVALAIPGRELPGNEDIALNEISPAYFASLRVPLLSGRFFTQADRHDSEPVVILSEAAARKYFAGRDAIGQVVELDVRRTVVGVVRSMRDRGPERDWRAQAFVPLAQRDVVGGTIVMRVARGAQVLPAVREAVWSEFPDLPIPDTYTLEHYLNGLIAQRRFNMLLLGLFGLLALVIASAGIYGVMAYLVTERTQEIGIRMALGALPATIQRAVLTRALAYVSSGLTLGLIMAWALSGLVQSFLFEVQPHDAYVYTGVCIVLLLTALAASYLPAQRAAAVDPLVALKAD
jgi:predicted permease